MDMPKLKPVPIPTKGKGFIKGLWITLTIRRQWDVVEDWDFELPNRQVITIPCGFRFDGASIPAPVYFLAGVVLLLALLGWQFSPWLSAVLGAVFLATGALMSPVGILLIAGLIHDYCYRYGYLWRYNANTLDWDKYVYEEGDRLAYDQLFLEVNLKVNGMIILDRVAAGLLMMFGAIAWTENRDRHAPDIYPRGNLD